MYDLKLKLAELRRVMELHDIFQQDDEVGLALQEVEQSFDDICSTILRSMVSNRYNVV